MRLKKTMRAVLAAAAGLLLATPAGAHHSRAAFDPKLPVEVTGAVSKVEWTSPHARLYVEALDENGAPVTWNFELPSPVTLLRRGWRRDGLQEGDEVHVTGIRARSDPLVAVAATVTDAEGRSLFSGTATAP
jgi:hypothetical protein